MKVLKPLFLVLFFFMFIVLFVKGNFYDRIVARTFPQEGNSKELINYAYWKDRTSVFNKLTCANKIVFLGNSLTEDASWSELFSRTDIVNRGIKQDINYGIYKRLGSYVKQKPKAIFLMIGINDIFDNVPMDTVKYYTKSILDTIMTNRIPIYVESTLYVSNLCDKPSIPINSKVKSFNQYLENECKKRGIPFIDINKSLSENDTLLNKYTNDGVHLNGDGYLVWKRIAKPYIDKIPKQ